MTYTTVLGKRFQTLTRKAVVGINRRQRTSVVGLYRLVFLVNVWNRLPNTVVDVNRPK